MKKDITVFKKEIFNSYSYVYYPLSRFYHKYFYAFFRRCKTVIKYLHILWQDGDWDGHYLLVLMKFKIGEMAKGMKKHGRHVGYEKKVKEMEIACHLIDRLLEDEYDIHASKDIEKSLGKRIRDSERLPDGSLSIIISYDSPLSQAEQKKRIKLIYDKWRNKEKFDREYTFSWIAKKLPGWWD